MDEEPCNFGECVYARRSPVTDRVILWSTDTGTGMLVDPNEWTEFLAAVKRGEFDNV